jgi:hypothetical protein
LPALLGRLGRLGRSWGVGVRGCECFPGAVCWVAAFPLPSRRGVPLLALRASEGPSAAARSFVAFAGLSRLASVGRRRGWWPFGLRAAWWSLPFGRFLAVRTHRGYKRAPNQGPPPRAATPPRPRKPERPAPERPGSDKSPGAHSLNTPEPLAVGKKALRSPARRDLVPHGGARRPPTLPNLPSHSSVTRRIRKASSRDVQGRVSARPLIGPSRRRVEDRSEVFNKGPLLERPTVMRRVTRSRRHCRRREPYPLFDT